MDCPVRGRRAQGRIHHGGKFNTDLPMIRIQVGVIISSILKATGYTKPADLSQFRDTTNIPAGAKSGLVSGVLNGNQGSVAAQREYHQGLGYGGVA